MTTRKIDPIRTRSLRAVGLLVALLGAGTLGCGARPDRSDDVGTVQMQLTLPDGTSIAQVGYSITGNGIAPIAGTVAVSNSTRVSFRVGGIPAGSGYTIALTATKTDAQACSGSATFNVVAGQVTGVMVALWCGTAPTTGDVSVGGEVNRCAVIANLTASPLEVLVGGTISLSAAASSPAATFAWTATAGSFADAGSASTTYACSVAGPQTITLAVSGGGSLCTTPDVETVMVTCTPVGGAGGSGGGGNGGGGAGGATGGGGTTGTGGAPPSTMVTAPFLDTGYFMRAVSATGADLQSLHFAASTGEHQTYLTGNQNAGTAPGTNIERRSYFGFDLSGITATASAATLRLWAWKPGAANGNTGCYTSADAEETFALHSVDSFTLAQIQSVPFNDTANAQNVPVWTDLGDGGVLGSAAFTVACEQTDLIPSPTATNQSVDCQATDAPCGKWLEIPLNVAALAQLNAAAGSWVVGGRLSTINAATTGAERREWLHAGTLVDLSSASTVFPDFDTPAPQLVLTVPQ